jgi:hypothetical protein
VAPDDLVCYEYSTIAFAIFLMWNDSRTQHQQSSAKMLDLTNYEVWVHETSQSKYPLTVLVLRDMFKDMEENFSTLDRIPSDVVKLFPHIPPELVKLLPSILHEMTKLLLFISPGMVKLLPSMMRGFIRMCTNDLSVMSTLTSYFRVDQQTTGQDRNTKEKN